MIAHALNVHEKLKRLIICIFTLCRTRSQMNVYRKMGTKKIPDQEETNNLPIFCGQQNCYRKDSKYSLKTEIQETVECPDNSRLENIASTFPAIQLHHYLEWQSPTPYLIPSLQTLSQIELMFFFITVIFMGIKENCPTRSFNHSVILQPLLIKQHAIFFGHL